MVLHRLPSMTMQSQHAAPDTVWTDCGAACSFVIQALISVKSEVAGDIAPHAVEQDLRKRGAVGRVLTAQY